MGLNETTEEEKELMAKVFFIVNKQELISSQLAEDIECVIQQFKSKEAFVRLSTRRYNLLLILMVYPSNQSVPKIMPSALQKRNVFLLLSYRVWIKMMKSGR